MTQRAHLIEQLRLRAHYGRDPIAREAADFIESLSSTPPNVGEGDAEPAAWDWLTAYTERVHGEVPEDVDFDAQQMVDAFLAGRASTAIRNLKEGGK